MIQPGQEDSFMTGQNWLTSSILSHADYVFLGRWGGGLKKETLGWEITEFLDFVSCPVF
jgi:hypothetical protein